MKNIVLYSIMGLFINISNNALALDFPMNGTCGDNCIYTIDSERNLIVSAIKSGDENYQSDKKTVIKVSSFDHDVYEDDVNFNKIIINGDFDEIEDYAFFNDYTGNNEVIFNGKIDKIGRSAFAYGKLRELYIPEGVTEIASGAFGGQGYYDNGEFIKTLETVVLPDTIKTIGLQAFHSSENATIILSDSISYIGKNAFEVSSVICKGNNCNSVYKMLTDSGYSGKFDLANKSQCTGNYYWNGESCVNKDEDGNVTCASGFVEWDKQCLDEYPFAKKRWTPAEASQWLHDGNDNFVVITFKK